MPKLSEILGSNFIGDQGVQGLQGLSNQGVQGLQGIQGLQGLVGVKGNDVVEGKLFNASETILQVNGNTVNIPYGSQISGNIGLCTNPTGNITLNVTGIPTDNSFDNQVITFSVFVTQTGIARTCTAVNLNGVSRNIHWYGGSLATALTGTTTTNGYDIFTFTGINTVGSASTTTNYVVLGVVNGNFKL